MSTTMKLPELFGSMVFNEETMKERLSSASYGAWKTCVTDGTPLDISTANEIAEAMKQWAVEKAAVYPMVLLGGNVAGFPHPAAEAVKEKQQSPLARRIDVQGNHPFLSITGKNLPENRPGRRPPRGAAFPPPARPSVRR